MEKIIKKNYMYNLELRSLHYWYKNASVRNPPITYNNIFKIMRDTISNIDISDIGANTQQSTNFIQKSHMNFHCKVILRNAFEHWKIYVIHKLHTRRAKFKANYFHCKKLQKKVLNALSKNVLLKWEGIVLSMNNDTNKTIVSVNYRKIKIHCTKFFLRKYFKYWSHYVIYRKEKRILLEKANAFYNLQCLKKCITNWKTFVMLQEQGEVLQNKIHEARKFYAFKILRTYVKAWIDVCEFPLQRNKSQSAIAHFNNKLLVKCFGAWRTYHDYKIKKLNIEKRILTYRRKKLLNRYFEKFILGINESITERIANENAKSFCNFKLVQKAFFAWKEWYDKKVQNAVKMCEIKKIFEYRGKIIMFVNWRLYVIQKERKRRNIFRAKNFYEQKLALETLKKLHDYAIYRKEKKIRLSYLNDKSEKITRQLQNMYIEKWKNTLYSIIREKQKLNQATTFWELKLIYKYFLHWKEFSRQYKMKKARKEKLDEIVTDFQIKRFISHWHCKLQDVLDERKKEFLAISIMEHKILRRYFLIWKEYIAQKKKLNNEIEEAMKLHRKFLLQEGLKEILRNSLCNIDHQHDLQLENATMRSLKRFEILKKYFDKWHSLIYLKKELGSVCKVKNANVCVEFTQTQILNNIDNFKSHLVLPEYMMKNDTNSNVYDLFDKFPP